MGFRGRKLRMPFQADSNASCTCSSAKARSLVIRNAVPKRTSLYRSTKWRKGIAVAVLATKNGFVVCHL